MNNIELLTRILNIHSCETFLLNSYSEYKSQIDELIGAYLIYECGKSSEILCYKCDELHYSDIIKPKDTFMWRCPETGFHDVNPEDNSRNLYKVNIELLIQQIQEELGFATTNLSRMETKIDSLYHIDNETLLYVSKNNPISDEGLYNFIVNTKAYSRRGLIFCTYKSFQNREYELPRGYKLVPFNKVVVLRKNKVDVQLEKLSKLNAFTSNKKSKSLGRPSTDKEITDAIEELLDHDSEFADYNKTQKAKAIHDHLGNPKTPALKTIQNHIYG